MPPREWAKGDQVVHATKPEWGIGEVLGAEAATQNGSPCQRLTVRFDRAGLKTLSTAFAELRPASDAPRLATQEEKSADPLAAALNATPVEEVMVRLPERATDPFLSMRDRLNATLDLYRFTEGGSSLLDWACMQTSLKDPLSRFNRHELEQWFARFKMEVDQHLRKLVRDARKQEPGLVEDVAAGAGPAARQALRRADIGR